MNQTELMNPNESANPYELTDPNELINEPHPYKYKNNESWYCKIFPVVSFISINGLSYLIGFYVAKIS